MNELNSSIKAMANWIFDDKRNIARFKLITNLATSSLTFYRSLFKTILGNQAFPLTMNWVFLLAQCSCAFLGHAESHDSNGRSLAKQLRRGWRRRRDRAVPGSHRRRSTIGGHFFGAGSPIAAPEASLLEAEGEVVVGACARDDTPAQDPKIAAPHRRTSPPAPQRWHRWESGHCHALLIDSLRPGGHHGAGQRRARSRASTSAQQQLSIAEHGGYAHGGRNTTSAAAERAESGEAVAGVAGEVEAAPRQRKGSSGLEDEAADHQDEEEPSDSGEHACGVWVLAPEWVREGKIDRPFDFPCEVRAFYSDCCFGKFLFFINERETLKFLWKRYRQNSISPYLQNFAG